MSLKRSGRAGSHNPLTPHFFRHFIEHFVGGTTRAHLGHEHDARRGRGEEAVAGTYDCTHARGGGCACKQGRGQHARPRTHTSWRGCGCMLACLQRCHGRPARPQGTRACLVVLARATAVPSAGHGELSNSSLLLRLPQSDAQRPRRARAPARPRHARAPAHTRSVPGGHELWPGRLRAL